MKNRWKTAIPLLGLLCLAAPQARSQIDHATAVVGAGAAHATDGAHRLRGTLGQSVIGYAPGHAIDAALGFWHEAPRSKETAHAFDATTGSSGLSLHASPNPFSESTQLTLHVPKRERISLTLYDLLGQPVRTFLTEERSEGTHTVDISADDLASGRYTLILTAGDERQALSLLIVR